MYKLQLETFYPQKNTCVVVKCVCKEECIGKLFMTRSVFDTDISSVVIYRFNKSSPYDMHNSVI